MYDIQSGASGRKNLNEIILLRCDKTWLSFSILCINWPLDSGNGSSKIPILVCNKTLLIHHTPNY